MLLATNTLQRITDGINADNGATFRKWQGKVLPYMADAYRSTKEGWRGHLGASQIGNECALALWYGFRKVGEDEREGNANETGEENKARMQRLWNRGHLEEGRFIAMLLMIGARVVQQDAQGKQLRFKDCFGHYAGSMDGIIVGIDEPEHGITPDMRLLGEFKTYNDKRFNDLAKNGVAVTDEHYYVQTQQYMGKFGLPACVFIAVNKNTDALHIEVIMFDPECYARYRDRAPKIIFNDKPPMKIRGASAGFFRCKMCDFKSLCHLGRKPDMNCRTCTFGEPVKQMDEGGNGMWTCRKRNINLNLEAQQAGCDKYVKIPLL